MIRKLHTAAEKRYGEIPYSEFKWLFLDARKAARRTYSDALASATTAEVMRELNYQLVHRLEGRKNARAYEAYKESRRKLGLPTLQPGRYASPISLE